jgi:hypothetical protein
MPAFGRHRSTDADDVRHVSASADRQRDDHIPREKKPPVTFSDRRIKDILFHRHCVYF